MWERLKKNNPQMYIDVWRGFQVDGIDYPSIDAGGYTRLRETSIKMQHDDDELCSYDECLWLGGLDCYEWISYMAIEHGDKQDLQFSWLYL